MPALFPNSAQGCAIQQTCSNMFSGHAGRKSRNCSIAKGLIFGDAQNSLQLFLLNGFVMYRQTTVAFFVL